MRYLKKIRMMLLALVLAALTMGQSQTAFAADEEYTYTVRLFAGNLGELTGDGLQIESAGASVDSDKDQVVISGLRYGDTVRIIYQEAAASADERYYVRGVRRSGRDNTEAEAPTFEVACDRDYVVAYAVSGDLVGYTVHYLDASGNPLMPSDTYYGNAGERQYVSSRYIDGYQPQALNLVKTLSANESENVFEFRYTPVPEGTTAPTAPTAPTEMVTLRGRRDKASLVWDRFGQDVILVPDGEEHFTVTLPVVMSPQFFGWLLGLDGSVTLIGPRQAVCAYRRRLAAAMDELTLPRCEH